MRRGAAFALLTVALGACQEGTEERREVASTRVVMRPDPGLPAGSVPRGAARRAAAVAPPAPEPTPALLRLGAERYGAFCAPCHGAGGAGNGAVVAHGFPPPPPFSVETSRAGDPAAVAAVIRDGFGIMHPMAEIVTPEESWAIAHHVGRLRTGAAR